MSAALEKRLRDLSAQYPFVAPPQDPSVFLCHASADKQIVKEIGAKLEHHGIRAWIDEWEIGPGDSLFGKIGTGISSSAVFVAMLSKAAMDSKWCQTELQEALHRRLIEGKNVVPFKIENVGAPPFLGDAHYLSADRGLDREVFRLACKVMGVHERLVSEVVSAIESSQPSVLQRALEMLRQDRTIHFGEDWRDFQMIMERRGIKKSDEYLITSDWGDKYKAC